MSDARSPPRPPEAATLVDRALGRLSAAWRSIAGEVPAPEDRLKQRLRERMQEALDGPGGEVAARARTAALGHEYLGLAPAEREAFLRVLAEEFDPPAEPVLAAAEAVRAAATAAERRKASARLAAALESPRLKLLTRFNALPQGVKFLVDLRATIADLAERDAAFQPLLDDLTGLLRGWFDVGFLDLRRITWDSPASLLEKLIAYEAVHEIAGWSDLKNRLDSDRRCFAFFHPRMPDEPLIFVEVALTDGIASAIQPLLDPDAPVLDPGKADTAIFYSISNAQKGLAGISFGNFLIKQVVERLAREFPQLKRFATLSPIPGFAKWLRSLDGDALLTAAEKRALPKRGDGNQHPLALVRNPDWHRNRALAGALEAPLLRLAARYLVLEKRADGRALDPVAHFHLSNGARIEQLDWLADTSAKGLAQSCGVMVNYLYRMAEIEANHESYTGEAKIAAASAVRSMAKA
ncbi:MAG: malonyl-CoA decarboxylase family protein [Candidatus Odyssella sp.]|nr:malonyl-CoA decarboxylase family protein [Candidatus Odyssella sp.]